MSGTRPGLMVIARTAARWSSMDAWYEHEFGWYINKAEGARLSLPLYWEDGIAIYDFQLNLHHPLTLICGARWKEIGIRLGSKLQPNRHFTTDFASIPTWLQWMPGLRKDSFLTPFLHDSAYTERAIWICEPGEDVFKRKSVGRYEADKLLEFGLGAEGANAITRAAYFNAVHLFGGHAWRT